MWRILSWAAIAMTLSTPAYAQFQRGVGGSPYPVQIPNCGDQGIAPRGYHYVAGTCTVEPDDPCWKPEIRSVGAVQNLNGTLGKQDGVPSRVASIGDPSSVNGITLSRFGIHVSMGATGIACHARLDFTNGEEQSGIVTFYDPGQYAPLQVKWLPDIVIAKRIALEEGLARGGARYVTPDLKTPAVQECVGREIALGFDEQFNGQVWAKCADELRHAN